MLNPKRTTEIIENYYEFSGCPNSCNKIFNGAQHCLTSQNDAQGLQKTHEDLFWRSHRKKVFISSREKICTQKLHKNLFGQVRRKSGKILRTQIFLAPTPMKRHLRPRCPPFERSEGEFPRYASFSRVPVQIILHALSLLVAVGDNVSLQWT